MGFGMGSALLGSEALTSDLGVGWTTGARPGARRTQLGACILQVHERDDTAYALLPLSAY